MKNVNVEMKNEGGGSKFFTLYSSFFTFLYIFAA
jgi:hypothetical protein